MEMEQCPIDRRSDTRNRSATTGRTRRRWHWHPSRAAPAPDPDPALPLDWLSRAADLLQGAFAERTGRAVPRRSGRWGAVVQHHVARPVRRLGTGARRPRTSGRRLRRRRPHGPGRRVWRPSPPPVPPSTCTSAARDPATEDRRAVLRVTAQRAETDDPPMGIVGAAIVATEATRRPRPAPSPPSGPGGTVPTAMTTAASPGRRAWAHRALHDPLTDLPNRIMLGDHLDMALARCERDGSRVALLYFDVDRFKSINDTQGHDAGDMLLRQLADRLSAVLRPSDTVARIGGDEFVVLFDRVDDEQDAVTGSLRVTRAIEAEPFRLVDMDLQITVSAGVALSHPEITPATLLREADAAMYRAKERRPGPDRDLRRGPPAAHRTAGRPGAPPARRHRTQRDHRALPTVRRPHHRAGGRRRSARPMAGARHSPMTSSSPWPRTPA